MRGVPVLVVATVLTSGCAAWPALGSVAEPAGVRTIAGDPPVPDLPCGRQEVGMSDDFAQAPPDPRDPVMQAQEWQARMAPDASAVRVYLVAESERVVFLVDPEGRRRASLSFSLTPEGQWRLVGSLRCV